MRITKTRAGLAVGVGAMLVAAVATTPALAGSAGVDSTTILKSFHSNSGGGTTARISTDGNVIDYLSPDEAIGGHYEHIGVGAIGEGYVLCYNGSSGQVNAYDTGAAGSGFGPSTSSGSSATGITITRKTADNRLTLTQAVKFIGTERAVQIKMTVKNNTSSPVAGVVLRRQVDFDVDTGGADGWAGFKNWHASTTHTSAFAWNDPSTAPAGKDAHGMQLTFVNWSVTGISHFAYVTTQILDSTCSASSRLTSTPSYGDYGDTQLLNIGTIKAGGSQNATIEYSRY